MITVKMKKKSILLLTFFITAKKEKPRYLPNALIP